MSTVMQLVDHIIKLADAGGNPPTLRDSMTKISADANAIKQQIGTPDPPAPIITSVSPASAKQGDTVSSILTGTNFLVGQVLTISDAKISLSNMLVVSATQITVNCTVASDATVGTATFTLAAPSGLSATAAFTVNPAVKPAPPVITSVSPGSAKQGKTFSLVLTGTGFAPGQVLTANNPQIVLSGIAITSATQISATCSIPTTCATGATSFTLTDPSGAQTYGAFTVTPAVVVVPPPVIVSVSPGSAKQGDTVSQLTLIGTGFALGQALTSNSPNVALSNMVVVSDTQITARCVIAVGATTGPITLTVTDPSGSSSSIQFNITPAVTTPLVPILSSVSPNAVKQGDVLPATFTGSNFSPDSTIVDDRPKVSWSNILVVSQTQITATMVCTPDVGIGDMLVSISNSAGQSQRLLVTISASTVTTSAPVLTSISPSAAKQGDTVSVTLSGSNFTADTTIISGNPKVTFSGFVFVDTTKITASMRVAIDAVTGPSFVSVNNSIGQSSAITVTVSALVVVVTGSPLKSSDDLQQAITNAKLGDTILLDNTDSLRPYNWKGQLLLDNKTSGSGFVTLQPADMSKLPPAGERIGPGDAPNMPTISWDGQYPLMRNDCTQPDGSGAQPADSAKYAAHHYRFTGINFKSTGDLTWNLLLFLARSLANAPHDFEFDRCLSIANGGPSAPRNQVRWLWGDIANLVVRNCHIANWHTTNNQESQAIMWSSNPGSILLENNFLSAAGQCVFAGAAQQIRNCIPNNVTVRNNYLWVDPAWRSVAGVVHKNIFELKAGTNALIEHNLFENAWYQTQTGSAIVLTARIGGDPLGLNLKNEVSNIVIRENIIRHCVKGINGHAYDNYLVVYGQQQSIIDGTAPRSHDWKILGNLFDDISDVKYGIPNESATGIQVAGPPSNLDVENNTFNFAAGEDFWHSMSLWLTGYATANGCVFKNNDFGVSSVSGDSRGGPNTLLPSASDAAAWEARRQATTDDKYLAPPLSGPVVWDNNIMNIPTSIPASHWNSRQSWSATFPNQKFSNDGTAGADLAALAAIEKRCRNGK